MHVLRKKRAEQHVALLAKRYTKLLEVKDAIFNFLRTTLVPELRTNISAGTTCNIHLILIAVSTMWAFPHQLAIILNNLDLAIIATHLAVVRLRIELRIHDVIVDKLHNPENGLKIILHIGNLNVRNGSTRRKTLKLRLKLQFLEGVDLFCYMHVIAVGDIALVLSLIHI